MATTSSETLATALRQHQSGDLRSAEQIYRSILQSEPNNADALHYLGVIAHQCGQHASAVELMQRAVALVPGNSAVFNNLGEAYRALGELSEAEKCYRRALEIDPSSSDPINNLGNVFLAQSRWADAISHYRRALQYRPGAAGTHYNLGVALQSQGDLGAAIASYRKSLEIEPQHLRALRSLGTALQQVGRLDDAVTTYRRALEIDPADATAHYNLATALQTLDKWREAIASLQQAIQLAPNFAPAHVELANVLREAGSLRQALASVERGLEASPDHAEAYVARAAILNDLGRLDEAEASCRRALELQPGSAGAWCNLGVILQEQGRFDESRQCYKRSVELNPKNAQAQSNLGNALRDGGELDAALTAYGHAIELKPDFAEAHCNRSLVQLLRGDFERGWPEYAWRWKAKDSRCHTFSQPMWDGSPLNGKTVFLFAEQGFGDTMQFIRYAQKVRDRGGRVVVECQKPLVPLLSRCPGVDKLIGAGDALPAFAFFAPLLSLPCLLQTSLQTIPAKVPYIFADPKLVEKWSRRLASVKGFKVGICWQGSPKYRLDRQRSIPLHHFAPLAEVPGVTLISLQKGFGTEQISDIRDRVPVLDWGSELDSATGAFEDTAAVMMGLDFVVTSDTAIAHLAGALGVPVWVALAAVPEWRWHLDREDCPWYPTMRLFRQPAAGDWQSPFARIADELQSQIDRRLAERTGLWQKAGRQISRLFRGSS